MSFKEEDLTQGFSFCQKKSKWELINYSVLHKWRNFHNYSVFLPRKIPGGKFR